MYSKIKPKIDIIIVDEDLFDVLVDSAEYELGIDHNSAIDYATDNYVAFSRGELV